MFDHSRIHFTWIFVMLKKKVKFCAEKIFKIKVSIRKELPGHLCGELWKISEPD